MPMFNACRSCRAVVFGRVNAGNAVEHLAHGGLPSRCISARRSQLSPRSLMKRRVGSAPGRAGWDVSAQGKTARRCFLPEDIGERDSGAGPPGGAACFDGA